MQHSLVQKSQQSAASQAAMPVHVLDGWRLSAGQAMTLQPRANGALVVREGMVWATVDGPHHGAANQWGDVVLCAGERMELRAGQRVVLEALCPQFQGRGQGQASVQWVRQPLAVVRLAGVLRGLLGRAWARRAASSASRAQGAQACGASMASSGAL